VNQLIKAMKKIKIQSNELLVEDMPTTQEDNHFGVINRWRIFAERTNVGQLVKYTDNTYAVLTNSMRFNIKENEVTF
jgi:hypothetical protein